jgi:hypothetical protein
MTLPPYAPWELVAERLPLIFREGTPNRTYCVRELAASSVFAALYIGAVEGSGVFFGPVHVYRMTDEQAALRDAAERRAYAIEPPRPAGARWYADNARELIRDETLRDGLVSVGAVLRREDLPTTSGKPRYALQAEFASLFDPGLTGPDLAAAISAFQARHLSRSALARVSIMLAGAGGGENAVPVRFPSGETRHLAPGPGSLIAKGVIEVFAPRFLERPAVLWLSESGNKVVMRDDRIAIAIGLRIQADKVLPDVILADLGGVEPLIVFVEVVVTDGAITAQRQQALYGVTDAAGFDRHNVAFVTAYRDRESAGFRKTASQLAWRSFAWFVSEPDNVLVLVDGAAKATRLSRLAMAGIETSPCHRL